MWGPDRIGFAAYGCTRSYLFLTWLPNYLVETMHMSILRESAGFAAAVPWAAPQVTDLQTVGGWLIDHPDREEALTKRAGFPDRARVRHAARPRRVQRYPYHQSPGLGGRHG